MHGAAPMGKDERIEVLLAMVIDLVNDDTLKDSKIMRALLFAVCLIAIAHHVDCKAVQTQLGKVYQTLERANGYQDWFPPADA